MMDRKRYYFTEGDCEKKLIRALKLPPALLAPGKIKVFNVVQNVLPVSILMSIEPGSVAVLVFDTDRRETENVKKNMELLKNRCQSVETLTVMQVLNFENEIERATDVESAKNLTKSKSIAEFKGAVNRMKDLDFRRALDRHKLRISDLWSQEPPDAFGFLSQDGDMIKR